MMIIYIMRKNLLKFCLILKLILTNFIFSIVEENYPKIVLKTDSIELEIFIPDEKNGFYRGSRFDWSGMIGKVLFKNHVFFAPWKLPHNPKDPECGIGICEEYGMGVFKWDIPLGFKEAKVKEGFIKIGVGVLEKEDHEENYKFWKSYNFLKHGEWKIWRGETFVKFYNRLKSGKYGYEYVKKITVSYNSPEIIVYHKLKNIGHIPFSQTVYSHNFIVIDNVNIGPDYILNVPFDIVLRERPSEKIYEFIEIKKNFITFKKEIEKKRGYLLKLSGYKNKPQHNSFNIVNTKTKAGILMKSDKPPLIYNIYFTSTALCPEPFIKIFLKPNEEISWKNVYKFFEIK